LKTNSILDDLNPEQREAVLHGEGPLLILAGAGSGKTRVITRRVAHLVQEREVRPWQILAVTFTNKAAREMRERLEVLLGDQASQLAVSTFHSAAAMILRREGHHLGLDRSFVIYDDADQLQLVKRAMREATVDPALMGPREILGRIDQQKNLGRLPSEFQPAADDYRGRAAHLVYTRYERLLRAANAVDFGDLLLLLLTLFRGHSEVLAHYRRRFRHLLVDEFQDTNPVQYQMLQLLSPPGSNLAVVGDDDQSIYRWRGATVQNILGFQADYPGARVVKLEQNYRSDQIVLEAAHAVISRNRSRMPKKLWSQRARGESLGLLLARDERGEAQEIVRTIQKLNREGSMRYQQMAIFYRVHAQSRLLEEALRLSRVPYTLINARSFYERAEIKDAVAYLRLMVNPKSDADLLRIINTPARGIGDTTVERLSDFASSGGLSLFEALGAAEQISSLNTGATRRLRALRELLESLHNFGMAAPDAAAAVEKMISDTGLVSRLQEEDSDESRARAENLRELLGAAQEYDLMRSAAPGPAEESLQPVLPPLEAFLEQISLIGEADADAGEGRVALMTLHAAKGLEFDAVFMAGMEDGVFPHSRALGEDVDPEEMAEERRLCYVGFTRARRRLFLSLAQSRALFGELRFNPPSRFLSEVPRELFGFEQWAQLEPREPAFSPYRRKRPEPRDPSEGPYIDRSYDQSSGFSDSGGSLRGARVRHSQFGEGEILQCDGEGPNAKVTVRFETVGLKRVIARFLSRA
jgi:DNA helicase-2/ATP-dependent DNA helicase PcrA